MSSNSSESDVVEQIKTLLEPFIPDITNSQKGEMTLYSPLKNMRFLILNKQKVTSADYKKFTTLIDELKVSVSVFISCSANIPFEIKSSPLQFYIEQNDLTPRFIEMLAKQNDVTQVQKDIVSVSYAKKKKPQTSPIDEYTNDAEGFNKYCAEISISKLEFEKARKKWGTIMDELECTKKEKFKEYIQKLRDANKVVATGTQEEFIEFVKNNLLSKITKSVIKEKFGNLDNSITYLNEPSKEFTKKYKDLKKTI